MTRVKLSTFHTPVATSIAPRAPMNTRRIPRLTFVVLSRLRAHGAELVGDVAQYPHLPLLLRIQEDDGPA
jgi:hypothetical protein